MFFFFRSKGKNLTWSYDTEPILTEKKTKSKATTQRRNQTIRLHNDSGPSSDYSKLTIVVNPLNEMTYLSKSGYKFY